jgi:hypothetical protein
MNKNYNKLKLAFAVALIVALQETIAFAQQRSGSSGSFLSGDINSVLAGIRAIASMSVMVVTFTLLAFYTLGWCGLAFILK